MGPTILWYKAWRESRTRFLIAAATIATFCVYAVFFPKPGSTFSVHIYNLIYLGTAKGVFALLTIFLGLGGLLREHRHRTATYTLAFPVSRLQVISTQIAVGLSELAILSLLPALLIPTLSRLVHEAYPITEAIHFSILWFGCGSLIFATSFLLSTFLGGEYTAPVVCYIALMVQVLVALIPTLRPYRLNLMWTMGSFGTMQWDPQHTYLMAGPMPWIRLLTLMLIAAAMFMLASRITQKQDF